MGKVKNLKGHNGYPELRPTDTREDLEAEIKRLRNELQQIREIVSTLFQIVIEDYEEDMETSPEAKEGFSIYT
ncbi:MAG: hypothetical protein KAW09_05480 [Thermoplasmata archaeon]|nr:hypothetical protein [Thermoplasmata archaeon]